MRLVEYDLRVIELELAHCLSIGCPLVTRVLKGHFHVLCFCFGKVKDNHFENPGFLRLEKIPDGLPESFHELKVFNACFLRNLPSHGLLFILPCFNVPFGEIPISPSASPAARVME